MNFDTSGIQAFTDALHLYVNNSIRLNFDLHSRW